MIRLASYRLDSMVREGVAKEEILEYLEDETLAVGDTLIADTTGIYGYFNGEYLDGSGWDPGEGYDPTVRPWYVEAKKAKNHITVVDPYIDMDTGKLMISLVKLLCDGESVVGIDLSMDDIQSVLTDHVSSGVSYAEFIVNTNGVVIADSSPENIGKCIYDGEDALSKTIIEMVDSSDTAYKYLDHDGRDYMLYSVPLQNHWRCVSVIDGSEDFDKLHLSLYITIFIAAIIVIVFLVFMQKSEKRTKAIRKASLETQQAIAASEAKTSFLSNMSHEIRTPVNAILGMNEMILRESSEDSVLLYSENIKSAGGSLLSIINDILDFSKIEAGKIEIIPVDYDLSSVLNDLVNMIAKRADDKGLILDLDFDKETPKYLYGDEVRIKQIITNILTNAVKYTEKGSITFHLGYKWDDDDPDGVFIDVSVKDTGIGIKEEELNKLFTKFDRIDEERNRNIEGTGLGMSITESLLEIMGSSLHVESVYGEGSVFGFTIKQKVTGRQRLGDYKASYKAHLKAREKYQEKFTAPDANILVVDDNPMNLMVFKSLIKQTDMHIDTAESGDEGIRFSTDLKYDIIFLDHMMPQKDGIETLHELRENKWNPNVSTPAICLTANAISGARDLYLSEGFDDYLTKPIDPEKLENMILNLLPEDKIRKPGEKAKPAANAMAETAKGKPKASEPELEKEDTSENDEAMAKIIEVLRGQDLIDIYEGIENSGSAESYLSMLKIFHRLNDEHAAELERLYSEGNIDEYTIKVHSVKSSGRIIGAYEFGEKAQLLENAGKEGNTEYIEANHNELIKDFRRLKEIIAPLFPKKKDKPEADRELLRDVLKEIKSASEEMNCEKIESALERIEKFSIPENDEPYFTKIRSAAEKYDYRTINDLFATDERLCDI